jgi:dienelactone hydrolase
MNINSHLHELSCVKNHSPLLAFCDGEDFLLRRDQTASKLNELLGLPLESGAAVPITEYVRDTKEYTEHRFKVETERGYYVPCHLLVPRLGKDKYPLALCLSGHGGGMHVALGVAKNEKDEAALKSWHHRAMALRSIKEGRAALVIEARNFGEASLTGYGTSCTEASKIAILMGRTTIGERVFDAMRILDAVLASFNFIDHENIVCTGNSGGGTATYYLACLDERITVAAPSCSICTYEGSIIAMEHCMCNHIPSVRKYFEMGDLAGLIAPRYLVIAAGREDDIFPIDGTEEAYRQAFSLYLSAGVPQNCALVIGEGGHLNYADHLWQKLHEMGV